MSLRQYKITSSLGVFCELKTIQDYFLTGRFLRYGKSTLVNTIYAAELACRYPDIISVSLHPGVIHTNLWNGLDILNWIFLYVATLGQSVSVKEGIHTSC